MMYRLVFLVPACLCAVLSLIVWWPALVHHRTIFFGDAIGHGWSLITLHAAGLQGRTSLLWSRDIYGGHPIFAEGQGGFAHPLNIALALLVTPYFGAAYAMNLLHLIGMLAGGIGMALLGRQIGLGLSATAFAALGVMFSPAILLAQSNITIGGALCFAPLALWSFELWIDRPSSRAAGILASMMALVFLAGYPQALHALLIILLVRLAPVLFRADERKLWRQQARCRATSLMLAMALFLGLTAVQLLPLLQLVGLSHRAGGVSLFAILHWRSFLRGAVLGDLTSATAAPENYIGLGSLLVWMPAMVAIVLALIPVRSIPTRMHGYALAALASALVTINDIPLYHLLHDDGLLPGMRFFRITQLYGTVGSIPAALSAGFVIERGRPTPRWASLFILVICILILAALAPVRMTETAAILAVIAVLLLVLRPPGLSPLFLGLLLIEIGLLRLHPYLFRPETILDRPDTARVIDALPEPANRRSLDLSIAALYGFRPPRDPETIPGVKRMLEILVPMASMSWGIPSLSGALALPLRRRMIAEPMLQADMDRQSSAPAGSKLIDLLAIRFLTFDSPVGSPAYRPLHFADAAHPSVVENLAALPILQGFSSHVSVAGPVEAARRLTALTMPALVVEDPAGIAPVDRPGQTTPRITMVKSRPTFYRLDVNSDGPGWVVLTDADYPGWTATIDGDPTAIFPAQLLAKAVRVPAGRHVLILRYRSLPFEIGLGISLLSLCALPFAVRRRCRNDMDEFRMRPLWHQPVCTAGRR